jgi:hypothetical protein
MNNNFKNTLYNNNLIRDTEKYVLDDEEHNQLIKEIDYSKVDEKIYYNLNLYKPLGDETGSKATLPLNFNLRRNNNILENPEQWEIGVENFSVATSGIPILLQEENDTSYRIRLQDNITDTIIGFVYVDFYSIEDGSEIYDYGSLLIATNRAIKQLIDNNIPGVTYPFIKQTNNNQFQIYLPSEPNPDILTEPNFPYNWISASYDNNNFDTKYQLVFNEKLYKIWNGFEYVIRSGNIGWELDSNYLEGDNLVNWNSITNPPRYNQYLIKNQQWDSRTSMIRWTKITFLSDMPIKNELEGKSQDVKQTQILDYIINDRILDQTNINYFPQYIKWNNLINSKPLDRINIRGVLEYEDGRIFPLELGGFSNFFMKLVFRKKK